MLLRQIVWLIIVSFRFALIIGYVVFACVCVCLFGFACNSRCTYRNADALLFVTSSLHADPPVIRAASAASSPLSSQHQPSGRHASQTVNGSIRTACRTIPGLTRDQLNLCQRASDVTAIALAGLELAVRECQHQFRWHRWNCSALSSSGRQRSPHYSSTFLRKGER